MWDSTVGINTRWVIKMSTQDQLITPAFSEVNMNTTHIYFCMFCYIILNNNNKAASLLPGRHCFIILEVACTQRKGEQKNQQTLCSRLFLFFSEPGLHRNLFSMPVFLCVLCVARGCAVEAHRFVVFHLFCHSPLTHHASPPHPAPPTHLQTGTCWPSRSTSSTSWTTSWSRRRAGTSSSAGTDCQMDRSQSHARYGSESSLIGRWVGEGEWLGGGGGSHECSAG